MPKKKLEHHVMENGKIMPGKTHQAYMEAEARREGMSVKKGGKKGGKRGGC